MRKYYNSHDITLWLNKIQDQPPSQKDEAFEEPVEWPPSPSEKCLSSPAESSISESEYYFAIETATQDYLMGVKIPCRNIIIEILEYFCKIGISQPSLENIKIMATQRQTLNTLYQLKESHRDHAAVALSQRFLPAQKQQKHGCHTQIKKILREHFCSANLCNATVIAETQKKLDACDGKNTDASHALAF
ncbi:MAG: hypothetical protein ACD_42C00457G0005 [uncultured bacterium]|nr:MAG: hypothetical protein ACD_42C00457G0005 [uncultured bacterium]OGT34542.1 MAG: hypothetical protein A3C44_08290 [Gammaproteobacteria bacterium RIFCSPHIGHO2_02_FULL_39_13]OGT50603.1 MAG: hypothetical protein A3E53_03700 [Gammaproteobacteria bacterium RIFCSPHIGHO2_12_FULL_39_24]